MYVAELKFRHLLNFLRTFVSHSSEMCDTKIIINSDFSVGYIYKSVLAILRVRMSVRFGSSLGAFVYVGLDLVHLNFLDSRLPINKKMYCVNFKRLR